MTDIALIRTHHSLHEGAGKVKDYVKFASKNNIKALIMADRASMADTINFYTTCKEHNINPIAGTLLSVFDEERVYEAQSSRNGSFFEELYFYLSVLKGEKICASYVSKKFSAIEQQIITPLKKAALAKPKAISSQFKEASLLTLEACRVIGEPQTIIQSEKHVSQQGYNGATAKKSLSKLNKRQGFFSEITHPETQFNNYILAYAVAQTIILSGITSFTKHELIERYIRNRDEFSLFIKTSKIISKLYESWANVQKGQNLSSRFCSVFISTLAKDLEKILKQRGLSDSAQTRCLKGMINGTLHLSIDPVGRYIITNSKDNSQLHDLQLNDIDIAKVHLGSLLLTSKGGFRPFPMSSLETMSDLEYRELLTHILYPAMLDAASKYKNKHEGCYSDITLFANTPEGYLNLKKLVSLCYLEGQTEELIEKKGDKRKISSFPKITINRLRQFHTGLVAIIGLDNDEVDKAVRYNTCLDDAAHYYIDIFGEKNTVIGIQKSTTEQDGKYIQSIEEYRNHKLIEMAKRNQLVAFALNNAFYLNKADYEIMDYKAAILLDEQVDSLSRSKTYHHGHYLKTPNQLATQFKHLPQLTKNTSKLSNYLGIGDHLNIQIDQPELPKYPIPDGMTETTYMKKLAEEGMWTKFEHNAIIKYKVKNREELTQEQKVELEHLQKEFINRLEYEINIIDEMGFSGYFLIVADFIKWAKENGVPVGHGRGSGAGSLIAYSLNITDVDPIKYNLLFERFLNPERVSMPDFDIDFGAGFHPITGEAMNRDSVIGYVQNKYNHKNTLFPSVGQIATHGLLGAKSGIKKIAKTRNLLPSFSDQLTKLFPDIPEVKTADCYEVPEVDYRTSKEREVSELLTLTEKMEGLKQNSGVHAGGVVIAKTELVDYSPFHLDTRDMSKVIAQFDKNDVEHAGLVKFDFLGLSNLTIMEYARKYIREFHGKSINLEKIPYDDPNVFRLLKAGNSHGVFQVESEGMRKLLRKLQCDNMEDLSALLALYRPGPLQSGMVENFIDRKHGREDISYPDAKWQHESLKEILEPTYGIILYQEQVMQCAQKMAGYTLGGADLLRRAMGKKKAEEMAKQRQIFSEGSVKNGIDKELSMKIFDLIEKFAGYGFNKSHSMAYAHITYQTAYLKAHYPCEYMSALLTDQADTPDKLKLSIIDSKRNNIKILPPDINKSDTEFLPEGKMAIRYGLLAIKGAGEDKLKNILVEREKRGKFESILDLRKRCGGAFDKKMAESLLLSGALDSLKTELKIPKGALRIDNEIPPTSPSNPEIDGLELEIGKKKQELELVVKHGKALSEMIQGLMFWYSERYGIKNVDDVKNKQSPISIAVILLEELPKLKNKKGIDNRLLHEDIKNLTKKINEREELKKKYISTKTSLDRTTEVYEDQKDTLLSDTTTKSEEGLRLVNFDKRSYLWQDINVLVNRLRVADISNKEKRNKARETISYKETERFTDAYRLKQEMNYLAYYVSGHPFDVDNMRSNIAKEFNNTPIDNLTYPTLDGLDSEERYQVIRHTAPSRVAGVITEIRVIKIKKEGKNLGRHMAILTVDDGVGEISVMLMPDTHDLVSSDMFAGDLIALEGIVTYDDYKDDGSLTVTPDKLFDPKNISRIFYEKPKHKYR